MKIQFYLPESNDLVDPNFNFANDTYGPNRIGPGSDVYSHEIFPKPNFDGILVSKSNINSKLEKQILDEGGIHKFLRLSEDVPVMGDCGAFQYMKESKPPYTYKEICDYYENLGFNFGITLDHIITDFNLEYDQKNTLFKLSPTDDMKFRYHLTLDYAKKIRDFVLKRKLTFEPVACVQGWSPESYHDGIQKLIGFGYKYIALGGLAKASNKTILSVLKEIQNTVVNSGVRLHILGVARLNILDEFTKSNVISCDSSSSLMQAFKSSSDNYYMPDKNYTAVRIPSVDSHPPSPKVQKLLRPFKKDNNEKGLEKERGRLRILENKALTSVRAYANNKLTLPKTMKDLIEYENEFGNEKQHYELFEETLHGRPWEKCPCTICMKLGIEVVILRGNNRNRRRGFHNTYVFYREFKDKVKSF